MKLQTKSGSLVTVTYEHDGCLLFGIKGIGSIRFNRMKASLENRVCAELLGWKNRLGDGAAVSADPATGKVDPQAKFDRVKALVDFYEAGGVEWAMKAQAAKRDDAGLVLLALTRVWKRDVEACEAMLAKLAAKRDTTREAILADAGKSPDVLTAIADIKAERARENKRVNAADMLAELADDEEGDDDAPSGGDDAPF